MKTKIFTKARGLMMLILATMISTNVWAVDPPTLAGLSFPSPSIDENFNDVSAYSIQTKQAIATSQTLFGDINHLYNNNSSSQNTIAICEAGNNMTSNYFALTQGSSNQLIGQISGGDYFAQAGAWRATVEKTSHGYLGLYNSTSDVSGVSRTLVSAFIQINNGAISIQDGDGSSHWTSVGSSSENVIDICVIYNLTDQEKTYGGSISLPSMKAHVYIDGTCVNSAGTPTDFTLRRNATVCAFRVATGGSSAGWHIYADDIKVYKSLPGSGKTLSSIAKKTDATKTTYIAGETFNPAGLVITATYSDASTEDIAYTGNEAKFSFSPSTATALTTENTSVTVTYGGQTCSQSITVRSITLQAKDEDGNAIPGGGPGAPTFTAATRTITAAANAGNYVFKEWVVSNASATSTTTAPTTITSAAPTGNVTVTAKYYKPISVSWMVKGVAWTPAQLGTSAVGYNTAWSALTLPTDPTTGDGCGDKFMGWVTETIETPLDKTDDAAAISALNILNSGNKSGKTTKITTTTTFYAVFADYAE